jgi:hypothetical protein
VKRGAHALFEVLKITDGESVGVDAQLHCSVAQSLDSTPLFGRARPGPGTPHL